MRLNTLSIPLCATLALLAATSSSRLLSAAASDIVLYSSDVSVIAGLWTRASSTTGAGGQKMTTPNTGLVSGPLAAPTHYFEASFDAPAATTYHVWLRLRAGGDSTANDSVWVQFSDGVDSAGVQRWRIGTTAALLVNLEDCVGCGVSGWGWQDNVSWTGGTALVRFATSGRHTIRVQVREDGIDVDQIVLSPSTWLSTAPGAVRNDTTIVPKTSSTSSLTFVRDPYLQQVTASSAAVVWATRQSGTGAVQYQSAGGSAKTATATARLVRATVTGMAFDYYQHEAALTNLSASTAYSYRVSVNGVAGPAATTFRTAPPSGSGTVRFIAFGDSGVGSTPQRQLASLMAADTFDFAVHTGDVAYGVSGGIGAGSYTQLHSWFFDIYRNWLGRAPMFPSIGNHDDEANRAAPYKDLFVLPRGGASLTYPDHAERFYSFDYGPVHVVVLDTELAFQDLARRQDQIAWLTDDLARTTQPWKIAVFHRSPFSAGGEHGSDLAVRAEFAPIFETYGVALALSGHEHDYERSIPWRQTTGGKPVTYIVTGGGGAPLYPAGTAAWTATSRSAFHYMRATASACTLSVQAAGLDGRVFDSTSIDRCVTPPATTTPYRGIAAAVPGIIEAENFDDGGQGIAYRDTTAGNSGGAYRATDVDLERSGDTDSGYNVGWLPASEWLIYTVDVSADGLYTLEARVAANGTGGTFHVEFDGVDVTGPLAIPNTGGWHSWRTVTKSGVSLRAGRHRLRFVADANGPNSVFGNLNYMRLSR
jgi:hypothetical protein